MERGAFCGEVSFLDRRVRSTNVDAKVATDLYALPRSRFEEQCYSDPVAGVQIFTRIALTLAKRLRHTDAELQALEMR